MADPTAKEVIALVKRRRDEVLGSEERDRFETNAELADDYLKGRQRPKGWTDQEHEPYVVLNLVRNTVKRGAAHTSGGILNVKLAARDPRSEDLLDLERMDHQEWEKMVGFRACEASRLEDVWLVGNSPARHWADFDADALAGGFMARLGMQRVHPQQVYWDLLANDPKDALLGSKWLHWDTLVERKELEEEYPKARDAIRKLGGLSGKEGEVIEGDTITPQAKHLTEGGSVEYRDGSDAKRTSDSDYVRLTEAVFLWSEWENAPREIGSGRIRRGRWWRAILASHAAEEGGQPELLDLKPVPYGMPNWTVICLEPPFGESIVCLVGDLQNAVNVIASVILKVSMQAARNMNRIAFDYSKMHPDTLEMIRNRESPDMLPFNLEDMQARIDDVIKPLVFGNYDVNMLGQLLRLFSGEVWDDVTASGTLLNGDLPSTTRLSTRSISSIQTMMLMAQEGVRHVASVQICRDATIGRAMRRYHWSEPRSIGGSDFWVNQRVAVNPDAMMARAAMDDPYVADEGVVNGLRMVAPDGEDGTPGDETALPLSEETWAEAEAARASGQVSEVALTANDLAAPGDIEYGMEIEADAVAKRQEKWARIQAGEQLRKGVWSERTFMEGAMADDPGWSYEEEMERKLGETAAADVLAAAQVDPSISGKVKQFVAEQMMAAQTGQLGQSQAVAGQPGGQGIPGEVPDVQAGQGVPVGIAA